MNRRGVCYDVGRVMMEKNHRPEFDVEIVKQELEIIKEDLHCNVVKICGKDVKRLMKASDFALSIGLEVWVSPELWDKNPEDTMEYIVEAAVETEKLRLKYERESGLCNGNRVLFIYERNFKRRQFHGKVTKSRF